MRILAIDFGTVRIGTAISDELAIVATPFRVIPYSRTAADEIAALVREQNVGEIVIGMPHALDGSATEITRQTINFAVKLRAVVGCSVVEWDESFSSRTAQRAMLEASVPQKRRRQKGTTDAWAAAVILQQYLETLR